MAPLTAGQPVATVAVDQAIFASSAQGRVQGYQLIARSAGIDDHTAATLRRWSPSHQGLARTAENASSLNFFPLGDHRFAIARTAYGKSEYSARGSRQIATRYLIVTGDYLRQFQGDVYRLVTIACALGLLRYLPDVTGTLPTAPLPASSILAGDSPATSSLDGQSRQMIPAVRDLLTRGRYVAVTGERRPELLLQHILASFPLEERLGISFATGLSHSTQRRFRLGFFASSDTELRFRLSCDDYSIVHRGNYSPDA